MAAQDNQDPCQKNSTDRGLEGTVRGGGRVGHRCRPSALHRRPQRPSPFPSPGCSPLSGGHLPPGSRLPRDPQVAPGAKVTCRRVLTGEDREGSHAEVDSLGKGPGPGGLSSPVLTLGNAVALTWGASVKAPQVLVGETSKSGFAVRMRCLGLHPR